MNEETRRHTAIGLFWLAWIGVALAIGFITGHALLASGIGLVVGVVVALWVVPDSDD